MDQSPTPADAASVLLVLCTCPADNAGEIATIMVQQKLAACVNILPGARSIYVWDGAVQNEQESIMLIKTTADRYPELESELRRMHPYELPEIISFSPDRGLHEYMQWVCHSTNPEK